MSLPSDPWERPALARGQEQLALDPRALHVALPVLEASLPALDQAWALTEMLQAHVHALQVHCVLESLRATWPAQILDCQWQVRRTASGQAYVDLEVGAVRDPKDPALPQAVKDWMQEGNDLVQDLPASVIESLESLAFGCRWEGPAAIPHALEQLLPAALQAAARARGLSLAMPDASPAPKPRF